VPAARAAATANILSLVGIAISVKYHKQRQSAATEL